MTQIDKILAEIERLKEQSVKSLTDGEEHAQFEYDVACGYENALIELKSFIESLEKEQPQGLDKPRDCGKGIHKQEYTGCDMSWMDEWKYASKGLDEAAEEFARTTFTQPYSETPEKEITIIEPDKLAGFKAGAKWMAEQGVTKECPIGLATEEIYCNITEKTLDELGICPGDNVIIQIRKKE